VIKHCALAVWPTYKLPFCMFATGAQPPVSADDIHDNVSVNVSANKPFFSVHLLQFCVNLTLNFCSKLQMDAKTYNGSTVEWIEQSCS